MQSLVRVESVNGLVGLRIESPIRPYHQSNVVALDRIGDCLLEAGVRGIQLQISEANQHDRCRLQRHGVVCVTLHNDLQIVLLLHVNGHFIPQHRDCVHTLHTVEDGAQGRQEGSLILLLDEERIIQDISNAGTFSTAGYESEDETPSLYFSYTLEASLSTAL